MSASCDPADICRWADTGTLRTTTFAVAGNPQVTAATSNAPPARSRRWRVRYQRLPGRSNTRTSASRPPSRASVVVSVSLSASPASSATAVGAQRAARDVHIGAATRREFERRALVAVEEAGVHARVLVDQHRAVAPSGEAISRSRPRFSPVGEALLLVARRDAAARSGWIQICRKCTGSVGGRIELAVHARRVPALMRCTSPGRMRRAVADRVLVRELALEHVADDLHVAVAVGAEALRPPRRGPR